MVKELAHIGTAVVSVEDFYTHAAKPRYGQDHENPRVKWLGHTGSILVKGAWGAVSLASITIVVGLYQLYPIRLYPNSWS